MSGCKLVGKGCSQSWKHQEGVWQASSVCLHFPFDTSMLVSISIAICPHVYLTGCPCNSLSPSLLCPEEGSLGLRACGACGKRQKESGVGQLRNSPQGGDLKEGAKTNERKKEGGKGD